MRLSFSTNGWNLSFKKCVEIATSLGIQGIEIHDVNAFKEEEPFSLGNIAATFRYLNQNKISISCMDAIANVAYCSEAEVNDIISLIKIAHDIRCDYVRLHAISKGDEALEDSNVRKIIDELLPIATEKNVILLLETMGLYADTLKLQTILNSYACDNLGALWDFHHTVNANEVVSTTIKNFGAYVKHIHIKDSVNVDGKIEYRLLGEGNLPINDLFDSLRSINYDGYISLEMRPQWINNMLSEDIVFPQFVSFMSSFDSKPTWQQSLYYSKRGIGRYVWKKETLIEATFSQVLDRMVKEFPDQLAFKYTTLDYTRTYKEFRDDVDRFARTLLALGVKQGSKVAVWATNVPEWYIAFWATTKIGAILVSMNTAYKIHEAEYLLKQSDTNTLILIDSYRDCNYREIIKELCPEILSLTKGEKLHSKRLPFLRNVITVGYREKGLYTYKESLELASKVSPEELKRVANSVSVHDVCNMQYTSGTTGFPKGVMLTHYNVVNNGKCIGDRMDLSTEDRMMIQVPMFHCFGMVLAMTASMTHGVTILPLPYFSPKPALACINQERVTCFHGVPTMFITMLQHPDFSKTDFSYMRTGIMAGSPCPIAVMKEVIEKMNMKEITIVYGQTESSPGCTMSSTDDSIDVRVETVGGALPNIECRIVDPETNEELPCNQIGEFVARGYNIMKGYYKMPDETNKTIDSEGWLHTGDLALKTEDGFYKITGRLKDMIIRGGENLYPKEIEDFIYTIPEVSDVQVVGVADKQYGEEAYAYIILKPGETTTPEELKKYMSTRIAKHKVPRYIEIVNSFPMNAAGKILKYKMREDAEARIKQQKEK